MRTRQRQRTLRIVLTIFVCLLFLVGLAVGGLYWVYTQTDETNVPMPRVLLGETVLQPTAFSWHTPALFGFTHKSFSQAVQLEQPQSAAFSGLTAFVETPADAQAELVVADAQGAPQAVTKTETGYTATLPANGTYTVHLSLAYPQTPKTAYGTFHYDATFTVSAPPEITFSNPTVAQGDVCTVVVRNASAEQPPTISHTVPDEPAVFARQGDNYVAVIGAGYRVQPGTYDINITCGDVSAQQQLTVTQTQFSRQDMTISGSVVASTKTDEANKEWRDAIYPLYETTDDTVYWTGQFVDPLQKRVINTEYGLFRYTNGSTTPERHAGIDLDGETGDPVAATAGGRVVLAQFLTLTGNTVVIEHGGGLKSYYFHMDSLGCAKDDLVQAGDLIGEVGTTGYSTGAHLHFEMKLGRQSLDPIALLDGVSGLYFAQQDA